MGERTDEVRLPDEVSEAPVNETSDDADDVEEIRAEIEQTRAELTDTIDAIKDKIDPQHLKEEAKEVIRDTTVGNAQRLAHTIQEKSTPVVEAIKRNPVPAAVGVGVTGAALWLWKRRRRSGKGVVVQEIIRADND